jgi:hypothetical protein
MLKAGGADSGKGPQQSAPRDKCQRHHAESTQRDHCKKETVGDRLEFARILRCGFALGDPQYGSFFFGDVTQLDWSRQALIIAENGRM